MIRLFVWRCFKCGNIFSNDKNAKVCPNCRNDYIKSIQINEETDKRIKELEEGVIDKKKNKNKRYNNILGRYEVPDLEFKELDGVSK